MYQQVQMAATTASGGIISKIPSMISIGSTSGMGNLADTGTGLIIRLMRPHEALVVFWRA